MELFLQKTLAVIVVYKEKLENTNTFLSLNKAIPQNQALSLLVYDNSPYPQEVKGEVNKNFNITYIHKPLNPGISSAYNYAAIFAAGLKKDWLLVLDQDTNFNVNIFRAYYTAVNNNKNIFLFAPILKVNKEFLLSPCKFNFYGKHLKTIDSGLQYFKNNSPVNSGILVRIDAFKQVGGYNDNVPLDLSDHQFIERFKKYHKEYVVIDSIGHQNYSVLEDNKEKQIARFRYYCKGVFNFETEIVFKKQIMILFLVLKTVKKSIKYTTFRFFAILFDETKLFLKQLNLLIN